jgi:hypothetical protein
MKKIFTLIAAAFLTVATFAADRKPVVTVKASKNYEIVIDGQSYFSSNNVMNLSNIRFGQHSIKVYEVSRGFMFKRAKRLVDASTFQLRNNDVSINIDFRGQINIAEDRFGRDKWNDKKDNGRNSDYGHDQKDSRDNKYDGGKRF